ncbi:MAG TPA: hypothetical protein PKZ07_16070 [Sedimentisphaerales bacterium]|nr:hypothetical protein [Sedimentisphaerales bacterium]
MSLVDAIPQSIRAVGAAKASGAGVGGAAYGQLLGQLGQVVGRIPEMNRRRQSEAMQAEIRTAQLERERRQQAAENAINSAMSAALDPSTGSVDRAKFAAHLADTPAAAKIPDMLAHFDELDSASIRRQADKIGLDEAESDVIGSMAYAASRLDGADDQAGLMATSIASAIKQGTLRPDTGNAVLASILGPDGNPDPAKVGETLSQLQARSGKQRTLKATDAQREAARASAEALNEQRSAQADKIRTETALRNYSSQLARAAGNREMYARVYSGIPDEFKDRFDSPDEWTEDSGQRAIEAVMDPTERIRLQGERRQAAKDLASEERDKRRLELEARRVAAEERRVANAAAKDAKAATGADDPEYKVYKDWSAQYARARDEERQRAEPKVDEYGYATGVKNMPAYQPPPSYQKWQAMTPAERATVMTSPGARISDAEMASRTGQGAPSSQKPPTSNAPSGSKSAATKPPGAPEIGAIVVVNGKRREVTGYRDGKILGKLVP